MTYSPLDILNFKLKPNGVTRRCFSCNNPLKQTFKDGIRLLLIKLVCGVSNYGLSLIMKKEANIFGSHDRMNYPRIFTL